MAPKADRTRQRGAKRKPPPEPPALEIEVPKPDRAAFARRWAGPLIGFFTGCVVLGYALQNWLFLATGIGGYLWVFLAFQKR
ncbi:MAG: hypothetical protein AAFS07_06320 [Pseudomonadota bacterium]